MHLPATQFALAQSAGSEQTLPRAHLVAQVPPLYEAL